MSGPQDYEKLDLFYLGRELDPDSGKTSGRPLLYKNKNLTTHGVIIGMTGSGKTGLGIALMEEAAMDRVPALIIDPKGDMANLLLSFPELRPDDFLPWIDQVEAARKGKDVAVLAAETAQTWENGLKSWDQGKERIAAMRATTEFAVYTPGSASGRPLSVLGRFEAPNAELLADQDGIATLVNSTVSSLLSLVGITADPLKSREHILLSSILLHHWRQGEDLSLERLIGEVLAPPFERVGAFPLESFYPQAKRMELGLTLNNVVASPAFAAWISGEPLDIQKLLYTADGRPRLVVLSIAHLDDSQRMFFVTMLLNRLVTWMRRQEGSTSLKALLYMDEIFGYFPPSANPPSKKPMLLLLKQARAYGVGVVLATQNPVDLDYKGLANMGTWCIGRLQTAQDRERVLAGLAGAGIERGRLDALLANLRARTFLLQSAHLEAPVVFESRWVMSYLKGPISLAELDRLIPARDTGGAALSTLSSGPVTAAAGAPPLLPGKIEQQFVPPPVPLEDVTLRPWLAASATVRFFNQARNIDLSRDYRLRLPLAERERLPDWREMEDDPYDPALCSDQAPTGSKYLPLPADLAAMKSLDALAKSFAEHLYRSLRLELFRAPTLKLESRPGETEGDFRVRLADRLRELKDAELVKLEQRYRGKQQQLEKRLTASQVRVEKEEADAKSRWVETGLAVGSAVLGAFLGRKALSAGTLSRSAGALRSANRGLREREDVQRAGESLAQAQADLNALATELQQEVTTLAERYAPEKYPLESFSLTPRKTDIHSLHLVVQWEPDLPFGT
ncbi:MAG: hypothetical protein BWK76_12940 [Desulfobulbaceae bacterium A2]|nr:MAG: hypothetical protein BWK76_12940 [Desulfobulbaceae bacterium A2]